MFEKIPQVSPEIDTIRIFIPCYLGTHLKIDYVNFFNNEFKKEVASFQKLHDKNGQEILDEDGLPIITKTWEKKRADMRCSWWCKMQIFEDALKFGKLGKTAAIPCICCEFSLAKWYNFTNGVNRGIKPQKEEIIEPVMNCLKSLNILKYAFFEKFSEFEQYVKKNIILRRLDLSYNFKCDDIRETMRVLATLRLNNKDVCFYPSEVQGDFASITFGEGRGKYYKAMFYNKYEEQKKFFSRYDVDNTEEERINKKRFWKNNYKLFENVVRFEVQYNSKYFLTKEKNYKYERGLKMLDKLINLCSINWVEILKNFDKQLNTLNVHDEKQYKIMDDVLNKLENLQILGYISNTKCANLQRFICECHRHGWKNIRAKYGKVNFSRKYTQILKMTNFDIKRECLGNLPIMQIM